MNLLNPDDFKYSKKGHQDVRLFIDFFFYWKVQGVYYVPE